MAAPQRRDLGAVLEHLVPGSTQGAAHLRWPPDVFAICAYLLKNTGSYVDVLREWPPTGTRALHPEAQAWSEWAREQGKAWRAIATTKNPLPPSVTALWDRLLARKDAPLDAASRDVDFVDALLQLVALADEASASIGIPQRGSKDAFRDRALQHLGGIGTAGQSTLSPLTVGAGLRVLPKQHTPRGGLTLRSLTHHLALHVGSEVTPYWYALPQSTSGHGINLLIAPWPLALRPSQFQPTDGQLRDMPHRFGFMSFLLDEDPVGVTRWTMALIDQAEALGGRVDGVVFPEAALSEREYDAVRVAVLQRGAFLIAGVLRRATKKRAAPENLVVLDALAAEPPFNITQRKHHRWRLDRSQIEMYGLGGTLDPTREWWEHIAVDRREVHFVALNEQLSICCLVCEDLARQDPVAELVRSVGPNLVVALLMDAPQLGVRWPARYATVLADDPGSSVLTVTSAGMVDLTRPPRAAKPSRSIGLWKDARSDFVELELPQGAAGLLLNLCIEDVEEWTADGRSDRGVTGYPRLGGVHVVWPKQRASTKARPKRARPPKIDPPTGTS